MSNLASYIYQFSIKIFMSGIYGTPGQLPVHIFISKIKNPAFTEN